jgi:hypothetical protein
VAEGWPEKIAAAQNVLSLAFGDREVARVRYGKEHGGWNFSVPCHDCKVIEGELHVQGCDVEECPLCGQQLITCECAEDAELVSSIAPEVMRALTDAGYFVKLDELLSPQDESASSQSCDGSYKLSGPILRGAGFGAEDARIFSRC